MLDVVATIFWGLVLLSIIVLVHESGHFCLARLFGLRVKEFMLGLPAPNIGFKRGDTKFGVTALPLGGYCMIAGMEGDDDNPNLAKTLAFIAYFGRVSEADAEQAGQKLGFNLCRALDILNDWGTVVRLRQDDGPCYEIAAARIGDQSYTQGEPRPLPDPDASIRRERRLTYGSLPWWRRVCLLIAGSVFNLLFAVLLITALLMIRGVQVPTTTIESVVEDSPAAAAQIVAGDQIVAVDGVEVSSWQAFSAAVQEHQAGDSVSLALERQGERLTVPVRIAEVDGRLMIGVTSRIEQQPVFLPDALSTSLSLIGVVFLAIVQLFNPATFADTIGQTSSVVGISMEARAAASSGSLSFLLLAAGLSISIGLMNLLPIPPFDGGKIVIETIERILRRKISRKLVNGISIVGVAAMLMLFVIATNADIQRYFLGG
ncbi:MAG: M50 family metallopeptidase [Coriobacteriales bacterium]|jgi:regulator of sigma E protease|nr:M50 family metallopeptidase [Coriobacteriales bacterium]